MKSNIVSNNNQLPTVNSTENLTLSSHLIDMDGTEASTNKTLTLSFVIKDCLCSVIKRLFSIKVLLSSVTKGEVKKAKCLVQNTTISQVYNINIYSLCRNLLTHSLCKLMFYYLSVQ